MSKNAEEKANIVFDDFTTAYLAGKSPKLEEYLSRCPASEQARIQEAVAGFVFAYDNYHVCQVSENTVLSAMERLQRVRQRKQKLAETQRRASLEPWEQVVTQPLIRLANVLYPNSEANSKQIAIAHRPVPGVVTASSPPLNQYAKKAAGQIAQIGAENLLSRVGLEALPISLFNIATQLCLFVQEAPIEDIEGCLVTDGETGGILLNSNALNRRKRFTFAHEIGHYVLHRRTQLRFSDHERDLFSSASRIEIEASAFASYLLMPPALLPARFGRDVPSFAMADEVSETSDVSLMAVLKRLVQDSNYQTIFICSEGQSIRWSNFSHEVGEYNGVVSRIPEISAAFALFKDKAEDTYIRRLPADAWFYKGPLVDNDLHIIEESRRFSTGHIYTLISVEY